MRFCKCAPVAFSSLWICQNAFPSPKRVPIAFGGNWICQNALPSHWLLLGNGNAFWQIVFRLKATRTCLDIFSMALFSYWAFRCCSLPSCNLPVGSLFLILCVKVFLQCTVGLHEGISRQNGYTSLTRAPIEILRPLFILQLLILPTRDPFHAQNS